MTKIIGLTGGIGSGKTTVAKLFEEFGVPIFIADIEGKRISEKPEIKEEIIKVFGDLILTNSEIDRKKLATIVFNNSLMLKLLNDIIHPAVRKSFEIWCKNHQNASYVIYETAILFETKSDKNCFKTITVSAPEHIRLQRVISRDKINESEIKLRISKQWKDQQRETHADFTINNIDLELTKIAVKSLHTALLNIINNKKC